MRSIWSVTVWTSISICFHSCHSRSSSQRKRGVRFCWASSTTMGRFLRRGMGCAGKMMPRSNRKPRISFISAVRTCISLSRTRCRVHGLYIELLLRLDRHKAHVQFGHSFRDRFRIDEVVLVRLPVRLYELGGDESHFVALFSMKSFLFDFR